MQYNCPPSLDSSSKIVSRVTPASGWEKGQVENQVGLVRERFFTPRLRSESAIELVDGGIWANNPIGGAAIEAIGVLGWPGDGLKILSIGTINEPGVLPRLRGKLPMAASATRLFTAGQAHSAMGTAKIITGDVHHRKAIWRVDQTAPAGRLYA